MGVVTQPRRAVVRNSSPALNPTIHVAAYGLKVTLRKSRRGDQAVATSTRAPTAQCETLVACVVAGPTAYIGSRFEPSVDTGWAKASLPTGASAITSPPCFLGSNSDSISRSSSAWTSPESTRQAKRSRSPSGELGATPSVAINATQSRHTQTQSRSASGILSRTSRVKFTCWLQHSAPIAPFAPADAIAQALGPPQSAQLDITNLPERRTPPLRPRALTVESL